MRQRYLGGRVFRAWIREPSLRSTSENQSTLVEHWDRASWTFSPTSNVGFSDTLDATASIDGNAWLVGSYFNAAISSTLVLGVTSI